MNGIKSIIITGAAGFVASNLIKPLKGHNLYLVDDLSHGNLENITQNTSELLGCVDFNSIPEKILNQYDILIHCATTNLIESQFNPIRTFQNNSLNTILLFQKFKKKIIYTSTTSIYGNADIIPTPENAEMKCTNSYDTSKKIAELFLEWRGNYSCLRLSNVVGRGQRPTSSWAGVVPLMIGQALSKNPIIEIIGSGNQTRDFTVMEDVVSAIIKCVELPPLNTAINIASGTETSIGDLAHLIQKLVGNKNYEIKYIPNRSIDTISRRCLDISKAKELLGWKPTITLKHGIADTIDWVKTLSVTA